MRHRDANMAAFAALQGPRKKTKFDAPGEGGGGASFFKLLLEMESYFISSILYSIISTIKEEKFDAPDSEQVCFLFAPIEVLLVN